MYIIKKPNQVFSVYRLGHTKFTFDTPRKICVFIVAIVTIICYYDTYGTFTFLLDPRLAPTNKIIFIDTVTTYCEQLRMELKNFSTRIPTSTY